MFEKARNSKQQGDIGLGYAIAYFTKEGYTVCVPLTDSQEYDLVVENGTLLRVQVKTTSHRNKYGSFEVQLVTKGGNQSWGGVSKKLDRSKVDAIFALTSEGDQYFIPCSAFEGNLSITVTKKYKDYKI